MSDDMEEQDSNKLQVLLSTGYDWTSEQQATFEDAIDMICTGMGLSLEIDYPFSSEELFKKHPQEQILKMTFTGMDTSIGLVESVGVLNFFSLLNPEDILVESSYFGTAGKIRSAPFTSLPEGSHE